MGLQIRSSERMLGNAYQCYCADCWSRYCRANTERQKIIFQNCFFMNKSRNRAICVLRSNTEKLFFFKVMTTYLCSFRLWRCCLTRASILAATSSHSLFRDSSWGVFRPLSSCGVSEHEKDLRRLLWERHTAAYCTMLASGKTEGERRGVFSKWHQLFLSFYIIVKLSNWPEPRLWLSWREFISLLNLCCAEHRLHKYLATFDLSVMKVYFFLLPRHSTTNLRLCGKQEGNIFRI